MRLVCVLLSAGLILAGCRSHPRNYATPYPPAGSKTNAFPVITPDFSPLGKVVRVNEVARFVILNFGLGPMPRVDQKLQLYRQGLKIGEIKITGAPRDNYIAADILAGEAKVGDEVREN